MINQLGLRNSILSALPAEAFAALRPHLHSRRLKARDVIQEPKRRIQHLDFLESGLVSSRTLTADSILETAMIGFRSAVNISLVLGWDQSSSQTTVIVPGTTLRIETDDLRRAAQDHPVIREHLIRHTHALTVHAAQIALCGARHPLEQRVACWVSLACGTSESKVIPLTHGDLSITLGIRRASIAEALAQFESKGIIRKTRGSIEVTDGQTLKQSACGCLNVIENAYLAASQLCKGVQHSKAFRAWECETRPM